ncbi:bifunctional phosphopantothenoylcysteine decarboxylase/phosphopantothenate--cysteine ligase CoaBC [bacterium]|nr:bifunctional phosphopantothenoylcysteine decarboxylase/phosphopantothenate--cysteine ligase CoaBC [bacterium]
MLTGKTIIFGVTGSIAAYKAAEIVRRLKDLNANVKVVMTVNAAKFIGETTLRTLSNNPVHISMFPPSGGLEDPLTHIAISDSADLFLVAPATANIIGKVASGIADDLLSTTLLSAGNKPVLMAPAMNERMYKSHIYSHNEKKLQIAGVKFINPDYGKLACGKEGEGRLASVDSIIQHVVDVLIERDLFDTYDLKEKRVLVTAGGTREYIDPVRFIGNPATGKMGFALAHTARVRGANVTLISGKTLLAPPESVKYISVETADQMGKAVLDSFEQADILVMAAAVGDFKPQKTEKNKIKRKGMLKIDLEPTDDILEKLGKIKNGRIIVGFAAETNNLIKNARTKLKKKNLDLIVVNDVTQPDAGFESETNIVKIIDRSNNVEELPKWTKEEVAHRIWDRIVELINKNKGA